VVFETLLLGTHHGSEAMRLLYENLETLSGYAIDPIELIDGGDKVVAVVQVSGVGPASQIAMENRDRFGLLFTIKNGADGATTVLPKQGGCPRSAGLRE